MPDWLLVRPGVSLAKRPTLEDANRWLQQQRHANLAKPVTYRRNGESIPLHATVGKTVFRIDDGYGLVKRIVARDYLIRAEDLVVAGQRVEPQRGDEILDVTTAHDLPPANSQRDVAVLLRRPHFALREQGAQSEGDDAARLRWRDHVGDLGALGGLVR